MRGQAPGHDHAECAAGFSSGRAEGLGGDGRPPARSCCLGQPSQTLSCPGGDDNAVSRNSSGKSAHFSLAHGEMMVSNRDNELVSIRLNSTYSKDWL